jgi:hypothetical protein
MGVRLNNGKLGLYVVKDGTQDAKYALTSSATASLVGMGDLSIAGNLGLDINTTGTSLDKTIIFRRWYKYRY